MRFVATLLAWAIALLTILLVVEGGLRLVGLGPPVAPVAYDQVVGWSNRPSASGRLHGAEFDAHWSTTELGTRVTPRARPEAPAPSVVLLGDSFVFGTAADTHDTIAARLQRAWDEEGLELAAVNAGVLGWDTGQAVRWFETHAEALAPSAVVLFAYENDLYWNTREAYDSSDGARPKVRIDPVRSATDPEPPVERVAPKSLLEHTALGHTLLGLVGGSPPRRITVDGREIDAELAVLLPTAGTPELDAAIDTHTRAALERLRAAADAVGSKLLLVTVPAAPLFEDDWRVRYESRGLAGLDWNCDRPIERFLRLADEAGVAALDGTTALRAHRAQDPTSRLFWREDWHLTPTGNEVVARAVAAYLTDRLETGDRGPRGAVAVPVRSPWKGRALVWLAITAGITAVLGTQPKRGAFLTDLLGVGAMVAVVMTIAIGGKAAIGLLPPASATLILVLLVVAVLTFVAYHLRDRFGTIGELLSSFAARGHWYLMPTLVVLIGLGSLLIVAASSPIVAPFVYTLF
ncbi:hypothetical protein Pla163_20110 [Planctomycetes bacterium Pla163]|uniref:AlgX/AlgJ SGNH hydrolase-like domain-containing protein n=1 Tax=Rohdeia mirabilis TaxID=2528008 RepID=A0A518D0A9_9BACT|nr:hypothetical protein Pla163_20110 [Planctomycetes bacterium Pla163]